MKLEARHIKRRHCHGRSYGENKVIDERGRFMIRHCFFPRLSIDSDSALKKFLEATSGMSATERAKELEQNKVF